MIKLEVGVSDKIPALSISPAYFTANLLNGGNDIIFLFFFPSVCVIIVTHLWLPAIHDREGEEGMMRREGGDVSLGAAGVLVSEKKAGG